MDENKLYFIKEDYFKKFKSPTSSVNKSKDSEGEHNRPCYYAFKDGDIYWMVPISSQVAKYEAIYNKAVDKYGACDTLSFVYIKGNKNVALIQNMIPVTQQYIDKIYTYADTTTPIELNDKKKKEINAKARKVVRFARNGKQLTFTPILQLEQQLLKELREENKDEE